MSAPAPLFTKRHYIWLAGFAAFALTREQQATLANYLAADNAAFNAARFHHAIATLTVSSRDPDETNPFTQLRDPALRREEVGGKQDSSLRASLAKAHRQ